MPRYTAEQKQIVELCRQYRDVKCEFDVMNGLNVARLYIDPNWDMDDFVPFSDVEQWLKTHATPKQHRGAGTKPKSRTRAMSFRFSDREIAIIDELSTRLNMSRTALIVHAVDSLAERCNPK